LSGVRIITENLSKRFNREWIFRNLSYEFTNGIYAITGPNGSGKSTLLQVLAGSMPPTGGGVNYSHLNGIVEADDIYRYVTFAAPYLDLIDEFTLVEHLDFHFSMRNARNGITIPELLKLMYLERSASKRVGDFSSGMKQRLKLALALFTESDIVLLDEPGSNLDRNAFDWYYKHLLTLPPTALVLIASNNPDEYPAGSKTLNIGDFK
jgi:ABC-type multidrug transport system ATPase subunit